MAYDPERRLVVAVVLGARTIENAEVIIAEAKQRLGGQTPDLTTSDQLPAHKTAIEVIFNEAVSGPENQSRPTLLTL